MSSTAQETTPASASSVYSPSSAPGSSAAPPPTTSAAPPPTTSSPPPPPTTSSPPPPSSSPQPPPSSSPSPSPASSNADTSSPSPSPSAPSSPASTSTPPPSTISTSTMTSQIPTTYVSTNAAGSTVVLTTTIATAIPTPVLGPTPTAHNSTNTGAIVGGVIGGVAGLALLALLIFYCLRRRARKDEFDGNFDPDRVGSGGGTLPQVDLTDEVAPFPQQPQGDQGAMMRQHGQPSYAAGGPPGRAVSPVSSPSNYSNGSFPHAGPTGAYSQDNAYMRSIPPGAGQPQVPLNLYGAAPADWHQPQPMSSPAPSTVSRTATTSRSAKEREAAGRGQGLGLATQQEAPEGSGAVVVHQDAGRAPSDEQVGPREIPPSYDSIQQ